MPAGPTSRRTRWPSWRHRRRVRIRSPWRAASSPGSTRRHSPRRAPPFAGGLVGFLGYDLGHAFEHLPSIAVDDQELPPLRLALHDWVVAWDRRSGTAWLAGRALDGDERRLARRLDEVHARLTEPRRPDAAAEATDLAGIDGGGPLRFVSSLDRAAYEAGVEVIRARIAARRDLPGEPHPPARGAVPGRAVGRLPPPADRRPVALLGVPRPRRRAR